MPWVEQASILTSASTRHSWLVLWFVVKVVDLVVAGEMILCPFPSLPYFAFKSCWINSRLPNQNQAQIWALARCAGSMPAEVWETCTGAYHRIRTSWWWCLRNTCRAAASLTAAVRWNWRARNQSWIRWRNTTGKCCWKLISNLNRRHSDVSLVSQSLLYVLAHPYSICIQWTMKQINKFQNMNAINPL